MKRIKKLFILVLIMTFLVGCTSSLDSNFDTDLQVDESAELVENDFSLVINPTVEYIIAGLSQIDSVLGIEADPDGCQDVKGIASIYFTSDIVDPKYYNLEESVAERGTIAGGSIDVYEKEEDAIARDEYLKGFDNSLLFNSGGHIVIGSIVIRTSSKLDDVLQDELAQSIVDVLTNGTITEELIISTIGENEETTSEQMGEMEENSTEQMMGKEEQKEEDKYEKEKICVGNAYSDLINIKHTDAIGLLEKAGFTNIITSYEFIPFDVDKEGRTTEVTIGGVSDFKSGDKFHPSEQVVVYYQCAETVEVPGNWFDLVELHYDEVKTKFFDAGFTDIVLQAHEIDFDDSKVFEGSVINICIGYNATFEEGDKFYTDVPVRIDYRVKPVKDINNTNNYPLDNNKDTNSRPNSENSVTVPQAEKGENLVWVPTNGGTKYHSKSSCSNMKNPIQVTKDTAVSNGYTACKRCH